MSISNIQKAKFLENLYRLLYSVGNSETDTVIRKPDEAEVKREFDAYFSTNRIGAPIRIDESVLRNTPVTSPDLMNEMMAKLLLNLEVLYDSIDENTDNMMKTVTVLNKKLNELKSKRSTLEAKVDDMLFSISNTDGYFYSFSDSFSSLSNVDLNLTNAFVDVENRKVVLPKLKSSAFDFLSGGKVDINKISFNLSFNEQVVLQNKSIPDINNLFDGLSNTSSTIEYSSDSIGPCTVTISIPLDSTFIISKVDGRITTSSAISIVTEITQNSNISESQYRSKQTNSEYDRFSFDFTPQSASLLKIIMTKYEPDYIDKDDPSKKYKYRFTIRDLIVSGQYYDRNAVIVSSPISINSGDDLKIIDAVSIEAFNSNPQAGNINFFVAQNVAGASNLSDFNWIPISSSTTNSPSFDSIVSFDKSEAVFKDIKSSPNSGDIKLNATNTSSDLSVKNPSNSIYNGISVYRIGQIQEEENPYNSYILDSLNSVYFKHVSYIENLHKDPAKWSAILSSNSENIQVFSQPNISITNSAVIPVALNLTNISGYLEFSMLCNEDSEVTNFITKNSNAVNWSLSVYLNGILVGDSSIESGVSSKEVTWNFKKGMNNIVILFNSLDSASGSISLMGGVPISNYGIPFLKYLSYVDPFDFRVNRTDSDRVFTIDSYLGNKEILSRSMVGDNSRIYYYQNSINPIESIRFRADLSRFSNPFGTPSLDGYRVKFKNRS